MRKSLGAAESVPADSATKAYTDGFSTSLPPSTYWVSPPGLLGTGNSTMTAGRCSFHPFAVRSGNYDKLGVNISTAQSGGTVTLKVGLYKDNGSGGCPLTSGGPVFSGTLAAVTSTGNKAATIGSTYLDGGLYWAALVYLVSSAPTTAPQVKCVNNNMWTIPIADGTSDWTIRPRGLYLASQTDLPSGSNALSAFTISSLVDVPMLILRAA